MDELTGKPGLSHNTAQPRVESRSASLPCVRSDSLFGKAREILIEHGGSLYRLRVTSSNKLILTK
jgi:hemin uptake protein HemP